LTNHSNQETLTLMNNILLDADMLMWHALHIGQIDESWDADTPLRACDMRLTRNHYWDGVGELVAACNSHPSRVFHCFTDKSSFRRTLYPDYKGNRPSLKLVGHAAFKAELLATPTALMFVEIEADDTISIMADRFRQEEQPYTVCSGDKDMRQVPGQHYWPWHKTESERMVTITDEQAERTFWAQALSGDSGDGVPGCPKVGKVLSTRWANEIDLADPRQIWREVVAIYRRHLRQAHRDDESPEALALLTARLVRLLKDGDYDPTTSTVSLWQPATTL
jgi:DNA polymerase-1